MKMRKKMTGYAGYPQITPAPSAIVAVRGRAGILNYRPLLSVSFLFLFLFSIFHFPFFSLSLSSFLILLSPHTYWCFYFYFDFYSTLHFFQPFSLPTFLSRAL